MPDLSTLTVSLDIARALKDAGFPQETVFDWYSAPMFGMMLDQGLNRKDVVAPFAHHDYEWICAAPTFEEVWALLPESIIVDGETYWINHDRVTHERVFYADVIQRVLMLPNGRNAMEEHISPVEASAALFLALVRAGHIQNTP